MAKNIGNYKIPFMVSQFGIDLCAYDHGHGITWKDNYEFEDVMAYDGYDRGRSSAVILFKSKNCMFKAQMFIKEFDNIMKLGVNPHEIKGRFTFVKRGLNYGLKYIGE